MTDDEIVFARPHLFAVYLSVQGFGAVVWWVGLFNSPGFRKWFVSDADGWAVARSAALADLVVFAGGSLVCAVLLLRGSRVASRALWLLVGATLYAALIAVSWVAEPVADTTGLATMMLAVVATTTIAWLTQRADRRA